MSANTLIVVLAHGKVDDTFARHLPYWERLGENLLVVSPIDDPIGDLAHAHRSVRLGYSSHAGPVAADRLCQLLRWLFASYLYDSFVIFEYDALFLGEQLPEFTPGLYGLLNTNQDPFRFIAPRYAGLPWVIDRLSLDHIVRVATTYPAVFEEGYQDRLLAAWATLAGVPILPLPQSGLFMNTILPSYYIEMEHAVKQGCRFFHGVKTKDCLRVLLNAYENDKRRNHVQPHITGNSQPETSGHP